MTDSHHLLDAWLIEGAVGDPPRELAVHASVCDSCARRLGAFDSLAGVDVGAAGSPPPIRPPTRVAVAMAWARLGTAVAGTVVAGILIVFGATQLVGFMGTLSPAPSGGVAVASLSGAVAGNTGGPPTGQPEPAAEPSIDESPLPTFIVLPSLAPQATPLSAPGTPTLFLGAVGTNSISMSWSSGFGGPVQKWEVWRRSGAQDWFKLAELQPTQNAVTNTVLASGVTYEYRVRAVNSSWFGSYSNIISATTTVISTPTPTPPPTPPPTPTPTPQCSDGIDNDGDGYIDTLDPSCLGNPLGPSEAPVQLHQCNDGLDNDSDGYVDFAGGDPSCTGPFDDTEDVPDPPPSQPPPSP
jgi:Fibronectin type III domain